ncbi:MAG: enoyl-CoA hydratase/isomerase family protein, partial [Acidobacteria bacterium]|nr:enoyl-CoA hydratase/isomerase family protein [Acidobacteriota bacterium]
MTAELSPDDYTDIRYEVSDGRARVTLAIPQTHNAITDRMLTELEDAAWRADDDTSVHCLILRGEGGSFCSGYDLTAL